MSQSLSSREFKSFRQALILSASLHLLIFILVLVSPHFPTHSQKGLVHYVNVVSFPGGGGGGSGGMGGPPGGSPGEAPETEITEETSLPERESLSDLTVPQNIEEQKSSLRHPVDKPEKEKKVDLTKKTVIQKSTETSSAQTKTDKSDSGTEGSGTGLRIGGGGGGGVGFGSEYSSQIGLSSFPYTWYLQTLHGRISNNWYTSRISTGLSGDYFTTISFRIYQDGHISEPEIVESSRVKSLDLSAIRAVRSSAPFPPLPAEYKEEYLLLRIIFEHTQ